MARRGEESAVMAVVGDIGTTSHHEFMILVSSVKDNKSKNMSHTGQFHVELSSIMLD